MSHTKNPHPPYKKIFFNGQLQDFAKTFELLTGSVMLSGPEKFLRKAMCDPAVFARTA